ncbi:hypothetical protein LR48_Vigan06g109300 [Vigna angularis]|uniref:Uncharacterized protein n=1 Tax=Phaseolus angularis TaxID=3914 RepID=A0A0L9UT75_PHAAN|nr:hypothetical protein LR48_Vigan06g109300 [Vigna angularis]
MSGPLCRTSDVSIDVWAPMSDDNDLTGTWTQLLWTKVGLPCTDLLKLRPSNILCNKQLDSWECGYYVMSRIKIIIRVVITDDTTRNVGFSGGILPAAYEPSKPFLFAPPKRHLPLLSNENTKPQDLIFLSSAQISNPSLPKLPKCLSRGCPEPSIRRWRSISGHAKAFSRRAVVVGGWCFAVCVGGFVVFSAGWWVVVVGVCGGGESSGWLDDDVGVKWTC